MTVQTSLRGFVNAELEKAMYGALFLCVWRCLAAFFSQNDTKILNYTEKQPSLSFAFRQNQVTFSLEKCKQAHSHPKIITTHNLHHNLQSGEV